MAKWAHHGDADDEHTKDGDQPSQPLSSTGTNCTTANATATTGAVVLMMRTLIRLVTRLALVAVK